MTTSLSSAPEQVNATPEDQQRAEYIKGLRAFANLLETHPDLPRPHHGQRGIEEMVFFRGDDAVTQALAYIRAMDAPPVISVNPDAHYNVRVVGRIRDMHFELCLQTEKASECECCKSAKSIVPDVLLALGAEQAEAVA